MKFERSQPRDECGVIFWSSQRVADSNSYFLWCGFSLACKACLYIKAATILVFFSFFYFSLFQSRSPSICSFPLAPSFLASRVQKYITFVKLRQKHSSKVHATKRHKPHSETNAVAERVYILVASSVGTIVPISIMHFYS